MARIRVGTCSWSDRPLIESGAFYPPEVKSAEARLRYYATQFDLVEVDSTYYGIPAPRNAELWAARTPDDFCFNVKAFRLFTGHQTPIEVLPRDVRDALPRGTQGNIYYAKMPPELREELWRRFRAAVAPLSAAGKLGAVLLQFPPWFHPSRASRDHILDCVDHLEGVPIAVEFRQRDWLRGERLEETLGFLEENRLAFVAVDAPPGFPSSLPPITAVTAPLALVRFHGRNEETWTVRGGSSAERFDYWYTAEEFQQWVPRIREMRDRAQEVHLLVNTNKVNQGPANARLLKTVLQHEGLL